MGRRDDEKIWNFFAGFFGFVVSTGFLTLFQGYVFTDLWAWFFVPLGLPVIGIMHGIGIAVTVSFLTRNTSSDDDEDRRPFLERYGMAVLNAVFNTLFLWGFGALAHAWM